MAGSIVVTASDIGGGVTKYSVAWTSDSGGNVSGNALPVRRGHLNQVKFIPGSGGTAPTDQYDMTIADGDGVDVLYGLGSNLSGSTASSPTLVTAAGGQAPLVEAGNLTPSIANAGNAKTGTVILYVGP